MKLFFLVLMAVLYILAGLNHFWHPRFYKKIVPPYIPFSEAMVYLSGIAEVIAGILLLFPVSRVLAAWLIITMLTLFFVVHIQMLLDFWRKDHKYLWVVILRLPLQFFLIWWAWLYTH